MGHPCCPRAGCVLRGITRRQCHLGQVTVQVSWELYLKIPLFEETANSGVNVLRVNCYTAIENGLSGVSSAGSDVT